jgi:hypothetical protein
VIIISSIEDSEDFMFLLFGEIIAHGTPSNKILFEGGSTAILPQSDLSYGSSFFTTTGAISNPKLSIDNCIFQNGYRFYWGTRGHLNVTHSEFWNLGLGNFGYDGRSQIYYPGEDVFIEKNIFYETTGFEIANSDANIYIRNNVFKKNREPIVWNTEDSGLSLTKINFNSFIGNTGYVLRLTALGDEATVDATQNYWETTNDGIIHEWILGGDGHINYKPILTEPHPNTPPAPASKPIPIPTPTSLPTPTPTPPPTTPPPTTPPPTTPPPTTPPPTTPPPTTPPPTTPPPTTPPPTTPPPTTPPPEPSPNPGINFPIEYTVGGIAGIVIVGVIVILLKRK